MSSKYIVGLGVPMGSENVPLIQDGLSESQLHQVQSQDLVSASTF